MQWLSLLLLVFLQATRARNFEAEALESGCAKLGPNENKHNEIFVSAFELLDADGTGKVVYGKETSRNISLAQVPVPSPRGPGPSPGRAPGPSSAVSGGSSTNNNELVIGLVVGGFLFVVMIIVAVVVFCNKRNAATQTQAIPMQNPAPAPVPQFAAPVSAQPVQYPQILRSPSGNHLLYPIAGMPGHYNKVPAGAPQQVVSLGPQSVVPLGQASGPQSAVPAGLAPNLHSVVPVNTGTAPSAPAPQPMTTVSATQPYVQ